MKYLIKYSLTFVFISSLILFSGCSKEPMTPTKIKINEIRITNFLPNDGTSSWDPFNGNPDIYVQLYYGTTLLYESNNAEDATPSQGPYIDNLSSNPIELIYPSAEYTIRLYDYDVLDGDDYMGGIIFTPLTTGNPSTIFLDAGTGTTFELDVSYEY